MFVIFLLPGFVFKLQTHFVSSLYGNFFSPLLQKSDGCNKMVCGKCSTFFCWLCEERLNPQAPYQHFSNPASKCYNLLFYGVPDSDDNDGDGDDDGWWNAAGIFLQNDGYGYYDYDYEAEDDD
jgi:hypothetical protein